MNKISINISTLNGGKSSRGFAILLFAFILITILPQMLYIQRGEAGGTLIKASLLITFYIIVAFRMIVKNSEINSRELLLSYLFFLIQILINLIPSKYTTFFSSVILDLAVATSYYFILVALFSTQKLERKDIGLFARLYQVLILYACLENIVMNWNNIPDLISSSVSYAYDIKSFFSNRNTFALFLLVGIYLTVYRLFLIRKSLLDILIGLFIVMNLVLTLSRTSLLGMIIFFLVLLMFREKINRTKGLFKATAIAIILIGLILVSGLAGFFINAVIRVDAGTSNRVELWITALNIIINGRWLTGVGYGISNYLNPHSTYLGILLTGGLLLMVFYFRVFLKTIRNCIYIRESEEDIGAFFVAMLISYMAVSMTESAIPFFSSAQNLLFTIIVFMVPQYYSNSITPMSTNSQVFSCHNYEYN